MPKIIFNFNGRNTIIQCEYKEKMKIICKRFISKALINNSNIFFVYNGKMVNEELTFEQQVNEDDKKRDIMNILVNEIDKSTIRENLIESKEIICPICKENILIDLKDYKINLFNCKKGHKINNIFLKDFENLQKIDISKIVCGLCKIKNKSNIYKNEFYRCNTCKINLCPLCKSIHNKSHKIIDYDQKNSLCDKHNENYTKYCYECNENICMKCENQHKNHNTIYFGDLLPSDNITNEINEFKEYIEKLNNELKEIIKKLNIIKINIELYFKLSDKIINNNTNRYYELLFNINKFIEYNNIVKNDIIEILSNNNKNIKFEKLMNIYDKISNDKTNKNDFKNKSPTKPKKIIKEISEDNNKNYIIGEVNINQNNINKNIRIINTFEKVKKENKWKDSQNDNKYENENEIKENCIIQINNKIISFSYFYTFNKKGKYKIKYIFKNLLNKSNYLFYKCESLISLDLSNFNSKNIVNMRSMFFGCNSLSNINLSNLNTQNVNDMSNMFFGCKSLTNIDILNLDTQNVVNMRFMFNGCESLKSINLSNLNTENANDMSLMFFGCKSLTNANLSNLKNQKLFDISSMFNGCESLINIDLSNFNTQKVNFMNSMFQDCKSLKSLDLSDFKTQNVKDMSNMFFECESLTNINLLNFDTQNVSNIICMFYGCKKLKKKNVITKDNQILETFI